MNVSKLSPVEYKYLLKTGELQEAYKLSEERRKVICKSPYFKDEVKQEVEKISDDLAGILSNIINRKEITCFEEYSYALDTAQIANAEIQILVSRSILKGDKIKKSNPLYSNFKEWRTIQ